MYIITSSTHRIKEDIPIAFQDARLIAQWCARFGLSGQGKQRYCCQNEECSKKTFMLDYTNKACTPGVKEKIINMALNGNGIRDTSRVIGVHMNTVMSTLNPRGLPRGFLLTN